MPEISRFFGIVITMYFGDHQPPHFHVRYDNQKALIGIEDIRLLRGSLSPRVRGMVTEWATAHREELMENWRLAVAMEKPRKIAPLE